MRRWVSLLALGLASSGCATTTTIADVAKALQEAKVSHCLYATLAIVPYGNAVLHARAGDLDCVEIWKRRSDSLLP